MHLARDLNILLSLVNCSNFCKHNIFLGCPNGWEKYDDEKCLKYFSTPKTWLDASESCKQLSSRPSYLVSVPDAATNEFILTRVATAVKDTVGRVWTGGYQNSASTWVWSDGATWSFSDRYPGCPNNLKEDQDYVEIYTLNYKNNSTQGKWNDHRNSVKVPYICQMSTS